MLMIALWVGISHVEGLQTGIQREAYTSPPGFLGPGTKSPGTKQRLKQRREKYSSEPRTLLVEEEKGTPPAEKRRFVALQAAWTCKRPKPAA